MTDVKQDDLMQGDCSERMKEIEDGSICDPPCDTTGIGRKFIGIELDPEYFSIAQSRINK